MSTSNMGVEPHTYIDVLAAGDFSFEESIFNVDVKEFGYVANIRCSVAGCNIQGNFPSRLKFQRYWEERHVWGVQKWACPHKECKELVRRKSDMKSHPKFIHREMNPSILRFRFINFIDSGLLKYSFRRAETTPTAGVPSLPGFPSTVNVAPGTGFIPLPVTEPSFSSFEPSSSSLQPSSLLLEPHSLMADPLLSTMDLTTLSTQNDLKKKSLEDYLQKPQSKSTQTYSYCDDDFAILPIPSSEDSLQMYIIKLDNQIDRIARVRLLAKERLEQLQLT